MSRVALALLTAPYAIALSTIGLLAASALAQPAAPRALGIVRFGADYWPGADNFTPYPHVSLALPEPFHAAGFVADVAMMHHAGHALGGHAYVGGEFGGMLNGSARRTVGVDAGTGETIRAETYANVGYFAPCARISWPSEHWEWHASGGMGLYMVRAKEDIEGIGLVDSNKSGSTFGGYMGLGAGRRLSRWPIWVGLESRVHLFDFRHVGPEFPRRTVGGPLVEVGTAVEWEI